MGQSDGKISKELLKGFHAHGAGYDVLRYVALPDLLGEKKDILLYFMGRDLARKFQIEQLEDLYELASLLGFGELHMVKEKKNIREFQLLSDQVVERIQSELQTEFRFEAGFIAEALQMLEGRDCECAEKVNKRLHQVEFQVIMEKEK